MTYLNTRRFKKEGSVLYNNLGVNSLYGVYLDPAGLANVGHYKKILAGSFLTADNRIHGAANVLSPYVAADTNLVVDNPWSFAVGDVLYLINDGTGDALAEKTAYDTQATEFGTVDGINPGVNLYRSVLTPAAIAIGDVVTLQIDELSVSVTAETAVIDDLLNLLVAELDLSGRSDLGILDYLEYEIDTDTLIITAKETGTLPTVKTAVVGAGTFDVAVANGIGSITITPGAGNAALDIGAKLSIVGSTILGVVAHSHYLTDDWRQEMTGDFAAYDCANINLKALPYMDGAIASALPTLKFMPSYVA